MHKLFSKHANVNIYFSLFVTGVSVMSWSINWPQAITMLDTMPTEWPTGKTTLDILREGGNGVPSMSIVRGRFRSKM